MYAGVPTATPCWVSATRSTSLAMPKSISFTSPALVSMTFPGLRSRWMMWRKCAWSSALAMRAPMTAATSGGSGPSLMRSWSVGPSTYSSTMKRLSFFSTRS